MDKRDSQTDGRFDSHRSIGFWIGAVGRIVYGHGWRTYLCCGGNICCMAMYHGGILGV